MADTETVALPVAGPVKKTWVYGGLAVVAVIVGYAYYTRSQAPAAPVDLYPPVEGGDLPGDSTTTPGLSHTPPEPPDPSTLPPTTNSEWSQRAVTYLRDDLGYDPTLVGSALGKYLAREPLTAPEADIVRTVEGVMGRPPSGDYRIIVVGTPPPPAGAKDQSGNLIKVLPVLPGWKVDQWINDVRRQYRSDFSWPELVRLNPTIASKINNHGPGSADNAFKFPLVLRIR